MYEDAGSEGRKVWGPVGFCRVPTTVAVFARNVLHSKHFKCSPSGTEDVRDAGGERPIISLRQNASRRGSSRGCGGDRADGEVRTRRERDSTAGREEDRLLKEEETWEGNSVRGRCTTQFPCTMGARRSVQVVRSFVSSLRAGRVLCAGRQRDEKVGPVRLNSHSEAPSSSLPPVSVLMAPLRALVKSESTARREIVRTIRIA